MHKGSLLFIQRRPTRAGAQTSLYRLVQASQNQPTILCYEQGWLSSAYPNTIIQRWPSARSLIGRISQYRHSVHNILKKTTPTAVIANDHQESPFAIALAQKAKVPSITILRSSGMSQYDFKKYKCAQSDHIFVVGEELQQKVKSWTTRPTSLFTEGFLEAEFSTDHRLSKKIPDKILIVGSSAPSKGFLDLIEAVSIIETRSPKFPIKEITLTGIPIPQPLPKTRCKLNFVGRVDDFISYARKFNFAIHPSKRETFGLAPLELIIAGIPTLCTETGILNEQLLPTTWLTPPSSPQNLAIAIEDWIEQWPEHQGAIDTAIEQIRQRFTIQETAHEFYSVADKLILDHRSR